MYRNFIFLDTVTLNDYLSAVKGGLIDGQELITTGTKSKASGVKISGVGGLVEVETASEVREKLVLTDAAKFDELFKIKKS